MMILKSESNPNQSFKSMTLNDYRSIALPRKIIRPLNAPSLGLENSEVQKTENLRPEKSISFEDTFKKVSASVPEEIKENIQIAAQKYHIPEKLIESVIRAESNFNPKAVSPVGARGLMQLMPGTAKELGVQNSFDIAQNIDGGAKYLSQMMKRFNGDVKLAVAAYNAGPGNVLKHGGVPPFKETQNYVSKIMKDFSLRA